MHSSRKFFVQGLVLFCSILFFNLLLTACGDDTTTGSDGDLDTDSAEQLEDSELDGDLDLEDALEEELEAVEEEAEEEIEPTKFRFAYAQADIEPPIDSKLGGFGMPGVSRAITAIHDPILIQIALFENNAGDAFIMATVDAAGFGYDFGDHHDGVKGLRVKIANDLKGVLNIKPEHIMFSSSHSHSAPDLLGFWQLPGQGVPVDYLDDIFSKTSAAVLEAANNLQDANIYYSATVLDGYTDRDDECSDVIDNTLSIIQAQSLDGKVLATMVNFSKHPTAMGSSNSEASADFIWGFREEMKKQTEAPGMYVQGFCAAVHGPHGEGDDAWARAYDMGKIIADTTIADFSNLKLAEEYDIQHKSKEFSVEVGETYMKDALVYLNMPKRYYSLVDGVYTVDFVEAAWHKLGPIEFAGFPGEGTPEYSVTLRQHMASEGKFIVGLANDELGYIIDPESLAADDTGRLAEYELLMGIGEKMGPATYKAHEEMGWFKSE